MPMLIPPAPLLVVTPSPCELRKPLGIEVRPPDAMRKYAVLPAPTKALYFVSRGDGSSQFSATLEEHNRAVNKYLRGQ